jgi:hypothetical protein
MVKSININNILLTLLASVLAVIGVSYLASSAQASGETAQVSLKMQPQGKLYNNAYSPVNWGVSTDILTSDPFILPMKVAKLRLPPGSATFNPRKNMPVCTDDKINQTNVSVPVQVMVDRCPNSILGNGRAQFALAQNNALRLDGVLLVFNGGYQNGRPKLKIYAYSYDTTVGVYTESVLQKNGELNFNIPRLTADSSVTQLNLEIPGKRTVLENWGPGQETVVIPGGQDRSYVRARCTNGAWPFSASFDLGSRDSGDNPIGPTTIVSGNDNLACSGVNANAKVQRISVSGPKKVKRNRATVYTVRVRNSGSLAARNVRLRVAGRGVRLNKNIGSIGANQTRVVRVRVKFRKPGKVKTQFRVSSGNAGGKVINRFIRVNR